MTTEPHGYSIVDSGDPDARWELIAPDGRTVAITTTKREARELIVADRAERAYLIIIK